MMFYLRRIMVIYKWLDVPLTISAEDASAMFKMNSTYIAPFRVIDNLSQEMTDDWC